MPTKFSEDVVSLSDLKVNPGKIINHTSDSHRPLLLTSRGVAVQGLEEFEKLGEELAFVKAIAQGLMDIEKGNTTSLDHAKTEFGVD